MAAVADILAERLPRPNRLVASGQGLTDDLLAGVLLAVFMVPVGMAYARAAGVPPVNGLYASVVPMAVYALLGPSRLLVLGPDSSLAPLIAAAVAPLAAGDPDRAVALAAALAAATGLVSIAAGLGGLGLLTELLSLPVRRGYLAGVAVVVIVGQLPTLLGFDASGDTAQLLWASLEATGRGRWTASTAAFGLGSLLALVIVARLRSNLVAVAVTVVGGIVAARLVGPDGLAVVGEVPRGLPVPSLPLIERGDLGALAIGAVGIALVSFADTSVLSQAYAVRDGERVDPNRDLVALGVANLGCGLFQGFPVSGSSSRTPVLESAGARSQLAGLTSAGAVLLLLVAVPQSLSTLPLATLAAILIVAVGRLFQWREARALLASRPREFALGVVSAAGVVLAGPLWGIGVAVVISLLLFLQRVWRPHTTSLVRIDGRKGYHDAERHPEGRRIPGLLLYRFDAPLFFANAEVFRRDLLARVEAEAEGLVRVVVAAEPMTDIDATADEVLVSLHEELDELGIELGFAELKGVVRDQLDRTGTTDLIGRDNFHSTVGRAVQDHVHRSGVDWTDWED
jgi:high affinity sulfate transporter 1